MLKRSFSNSDLEKIKHLRLLSEKIGEQVPEEVLEEREKCKSLSYFLSQGWKWFEGSDNFVNSWHTDAICEHLEAVYNGQIKYLIINIPPRMSKSSIVSVGFPAYVWTRSPEKRFLCSSYAQSLSRNNAVKCRYLISSPWYQKNFGQIVQLSKDQNTKQSFSNTKMGYMLASSVGGVGTGFGGDYIITDDPNSVGTAESDLVRESTNLWWSRVMSTRGNNIQSVAKIIVMQRIHENDLTGYVLSSGVKDLVHLYLPMEYEERLPKCRTVILPSTFPKVWQDPRSKEGELLCPDRFPKKNVEELKKSLGSQYAISGQLQQLPAPSDGWIFQRSWFKKWTKSLPNFEFVLQSWDTAMVKPAKGQEACYSACTTYGVFFDPEDGINKLMLLNCWTGQEEFPALRKAAARFYKNCFDTNLDGPEISISEGGYRSDLVLIEAKVSGFSLIDELRSANIPVYGFNPNRSGDKENRARIAAAYIEAGVFHLPCRKNGELYPYCDKLLNAAIAFPAVKNKDIIDSMSQALIYLKERRFIMNPNDGPFDEIVKEPTKIMVS